MPPEKRGATKSFLSCGARSRTSKLMALKLPDFVTSRRHDGHVVSFQVLTHDIHPITLQINCEDLNSLVSFGNIPLAAEFQPQEPISDLNLESYVQFLNQLKRCDGIKTARSTLAAKKLVHHEGTICLLQNGVSRPIGVESSISIGNKLRW